MSARYGENRSFGRVRPIAAVVLAICTFGCPPALYADDSNSQQTLDAQQTLQLLKQMQALQSANSDQAVMQQGFTYAETFAGVAGQPEITIGLQVLQGVLDFTGVLSSPSNNTSSQALATLTKRVVQLSQEVDALRDGVNADTMALVKQSNQGLGDTVYDLNVNLMVQLNTLYPPSGQDATIQRKLKLPPARPGSAAPGQTASADAAATVAANVKLYIDKVVDREDSLFLGYDISTDKATGVKKPAPGLKPHPGLGTYLFGLQLWVTAMEIESGGTDAGRSRVKQKYSAALRKHVAFLQSMANAGADPNYPQPMQDRIVAAVRCVWNVNGQIGAHPDQHGMCSAHLSCQDDIAHTYPRIPPVSIAWTQAPSMVCQLDPAGQQLSDRSFPPDHLNPVERALQEQYGLLAMDRMADILGRVAAFGTAVHGDSFAGSFGGKSDAPFFVYAVDGSGAVKNYRGYPSKPLPQAATAGTIANIKTLIPGGDKTFYALTKDGKLNWYQFTPARQSAGAQPAATTVSGPVTVASNFSAYKQVFGGSDGVIYAIQNDGTLLWFRHAGFANGGGAATMTGPKPVAPGFGQFKNVFSAGDGIIYAIADDGSLLWYRHKNFLTGVADATNAKSGPIPKEGARKVEQTFVGPSQLEGPINVGSGWGDFRQVIPSGDGVVLAVQTDGKLLWYRHDDYLTGVSSGVPSSNGVQKNAVRPAGWEMQTGAEAGRAVSPGANPAGRESSLASSWGAPAQAAAGNSGSAPVQHAVTGTPQWGTQAQAHAVAGTTVAPSALHESATSLHAGSTSPSATKTASGIGARQNVGSAAVLGVAGGSPHWEGPATIDANSGWQGFAEIAASLPVTVQTNVIK